jgi:hypothetical protein
MTRQKLIEACIEAFEPNYAKHWAEQVISTQSLQTLWELIMESGQLSLSKEALGKFEFRSAYILETVYCKDSKLFLPYLNQFFELFPTVTNGSMKRHFAKIGFFAIKEGNYPRNMESIATACADWTIDPQTRVAVKVWALGILVELRKVEPWINDLLPEVIDSLSGNPSAGMMVQLRRIKTILNA